MESMNPRSLTPLWRMPRSSRRSTAWANVAWDTFMARWWTHPGSVGVRAVSGTRSSLVKIVMSRPSPGSKYRWLSEALSRLGCSKTNGMPRTPSQKSIDVLRSAPTIVMWWTPWLCSLRSAGTAPPLRGGTYVSSTGGRPPSPRARRPHGRSPAPRRWPRRADRPHGDTRGPRGRSALRSRCASTTRLADGHARAGHGDPPRHLVLVATLRHADEGDAGDERLRHRP